MKKLERAGAPRFCRLIELSSLYDNYRFNEPWDSPHNQALQNEIYTDWISCPSYATGSKTPYKLVVGKGTAFEIGKKISSDDISDGTSNTIGLVEDIQNPVNFFESDDLCIDDAIKLFNNSTKQNWAHFREHFFTIEYIGFHFCKLDGSVHCWPVNPTSKIDESAFLINDGKQINLDSNSLQIFEIRWGRIVSLLIYVVLCFWPLSWKRNRADKAQDSNS